jgi:hypothetical protein
MSPHSKVTGQKPAKLIPILVLSQLFPSAPQLFDELHDAQMLLSTLLECELQILA